MRRLRGPAREKWGKASQAAEVKSLAQQTAGATEGVHQQLENIRCADRKVLESVSTVNQELTGLQTQVQAMASSVNEQNSSLNADSSFADTVERLPQRSTALRQPPARTANGGCVRQDYKKITHGKDALCH